MDPGTLAGIGLAVVAILVSMILEGGTRWSILLPPAMLLVFGGTIGAAMAGGMLKDTVGLVGWIKVALPRPRRAPGRADRHPGRPGRAGPPRGPARPGGRGPGGRGRVPRRGLELAVDGTDSEELRDILESELEAKRAATRPGPSCSPTGRLRADDRDHRHRAGPGARAGEPRQPGQAGPPDRRRVRRHAVGRAQRERHLLPLGNKVKRVSELKCHEMELLIEGIMAIQAGANPRMVEQKLRARWMLAKTAGGPREGRLMRSGKARRKGARRGGARTTNGGWSPTPTWSPCYGAVHRHVLDQPGGREEVRGVRRRAGRRARRSLSPSPVGRDRSWTGGPVADGARSQDRSVDPRRAARDQGAPPAPRTSPQQAVLAEAAGQPGVPGPAQGTQEDDFEVALAKEGPGQERVRFRLDEQGLVVSVVTDKVLFPADLADLPAGARCLTRWSRPCAGCATTWSFTGHTNTAPVRPRFYPDRVGAVHRPGGERAALPRSSGYRLAERSALGERLRADPTAVARR